jgi:hypothetical protein
VPRDVASSRNRGFRGHRQAKGIASLAGIYAAQGGEARQGPRQGELPASLAASLIESLSRFVTVRQQKWFVAKCIRSAPTSFRHS